MIKIAHEAPLCIFDEVDQLTDYSYCLVHLLEDNPAYLAKFKEIQAKGREVILDNSIFELGESFEMSKFAYWIEQLKPEWYIVPDVFNNYEATVRNYRIWDQKYGHLPGKRIGVLQGNSMEELIKCYDYLEAMKTDKIAIPFHLEAFKGFAAHPNKYMRYMLGRIKLIEEINRCSGIKTKIHLLGLCLPMEGLFYKDYDFIDSVDTSNPVIHGMKGMKYVDNVGLFTKDEQKVIDFMDISRNEIDVRLVKHNIKEFKKIWSSQSKELH